MIRFERVERIGEGRENFSSEKFSLPSQNPTSPFPKTFDFIESLFMLFGEWREVVFVNEESAVLKILGAF